MPEAKVVSLDLFQRWQRLERVCPNERAAEMAAAKEHESWVGVHVESASVMVQDGDDAEPLGVYAAKGAPFVLRILSTPWGEFKRWSALDGPEGGQVLDPRWLVKVVRDPGNRTAPHRSKKARAFVFACSYRVAGAAPAASKAEEVA